MPRRALGVPESCPTDDGFRQGWFFTASYSLDVASDISAVMALRIAAVCSDAGGERKAILYQFQGTNMLDRKIGGLEGIRTLGRSIKSRTLYLAELQAP